MNYLKSMLVLFIISMTVASCNDDDETPDPRASLEGAYAIEEAAINYSNEGQDTTFTADINAEVEFEIEEELDTDEMYVDWEEYVEELLVALFRALEIDDPTLTVSADIDDEEAIAEMDGDEFESEMDFEVQATAEGDVIPINVDMEVEGSIANEELDFEYQMQLVAEGSVFLEGEATGELE